MQVSTLNIKAGVAHIIDVDTVKLIRFPVASSRGANRSLDAKLLREAMVHFNLIWDTRGVHMAVGDAWRYNDLNRLMDIDLNRQAKACIEFSGIPVNRMLGAELRKSLLIGNPKRKSWGTKKLITTAVTDNYGLEWYLDKYEGGWNEADLCLYWDALRSRTGAEHVFTEDIEEG